MPNSKLKAFYRFHYKHNMPDRVGHNFSFLMLRATFLNFFQRNARNGGNFFRSEERRVGKECRL